MLEPVSRHLKRTGVQSLLSEVGFYEYKVDIYGYSKKSAATYAVELKLIKWRRALEQALVYQLCADFVWLAMPQVNVNRVDIKLLEHHGVGLIGVETPRRCHRILEARQSVVVNPRYRDFYTHMLSGVGHANSAS